MTTDLHDLIAPVDVPGHLTEHHAHQADIGLVLAAVTDTDIAQYRREVYSDPDETDEIVRALVAHECLHAEHGDDH